MLEHFLFHSVQNYYRIDANSASELIQQIKITHPYGVVGKLPWQASGVRITFGATPDPKAIIQIAGQIKTFTERIEDETSRDAMRSQLEEADTVVFLGFAFHPMNMELITPEKTSSARRAFATAKGISVVDMRVVQSDVENMLRQGPGKLSPIDVHVRNDLTCAGLLGEYWRTLSR
jgi:hypothetical protein